MNVLLINPPNINRLKFAEEVNDFVLHSHVTAPPLGLMSIKSYLKDNLSDSDVRLYNFQVPHPPSLNDFYQYLSAYKPDVVGITVTTYYWYDVCMLLKGIRQLLPDALLVGGGFHMWIYPEESLGSERFDVVVQGPGEVAFIEIIKAFRQKKSYEDIEGIFYKKNGILCETGERCQDIDLDELPFLDRSDFNVNQFHRATDKKGATVAMVTSRGCPYNCAFCYNRNHHYQMRNPQSVVEELQQCKKMGYQGIMFWDEIFTLNRRHVSGLCKEMADRQLNMPWGCVTRVDCVDREMIKLMAETGCSSIFFGVESGSQHILDKINKKVSLQQCRNAFALCREHEIETGAFLVIGFPGETKEEAIKTFDFAEELDADYVYCNILIPMPGSDIFNQAAGDPNFDGDWWRRYTLNPAPDEKVISWITGMTEKEMALLIRSFYRRYYLKPRRIIRSAKRITATRDFLLKFRAGLKVSLGR